MQARIPGAGKTVTITATIGGKKATKSIKLLSPVTLYSLAIYGSATLKEATPVTYQCKAKYTDGKLQEISPSWKVSNKDYAYFSGNTLYAKAAGVGKTVSITAEYGGKKATKSVKLSPSSVYISGNTWVCSGSTAYYYLYVDGKMCNSSAIAWSKSSSSNMYTYDWGYYCTMSFTSSKGYGYITATYLGKTYKLYVQAF